MTEPTTADVGRRVRQIRQAHRKSLKVTAEPAGISPGYLSRLETGHARSTAGR